MKTILHKADSRGHANHGWLDSYHTFSFANYHNPERMHFGVLRVLNDDTVAPGQGFGTHPHDNMEIISIPLEGDLEHRDSMGNVALIKKGDVQVMSAGTGVTHSEYNKNNDREVKFLQIWLFPSKRGYSRVMIRYPSTTSGRKTYFIRYCRRIKRIRGCGSTRMHGFIWENLRMMFLPPINLKKKPMGFMRLF